MVVNAKRFYFSLLVLVLIAQLYLPSFRYNIVFQAVVVGLVLHFGQTTASVKTLKTVGPIILVIFVAGIGTLYHNYPLVNIIKDITHIIKPVLGIAVGYFIARQVNDFIAFARVLISTAVCCAVYHLIKFVIFADSADSVSDLRGSGLDNFLELFALILLWFSISFFGKRLFSAKKHYFYLGILSVSCFTYFSRTMIVVFIVVLLSVMGYTKITVKSLKVIGIVVVSILLMYAYLFSIKIDRQGSGAETFFYKVKNAPLEIFKTKINVKDHKDLWDHWRGYEAKRAVALMNEHPESYVIGMGYGSLVNLKFWAPLGDSKRGMRYISELHNGYAYVIYKTGFVGLFLMLAFLYRVYRYQYEKPENKQHDFLLRLISSIGLLYFFTTLTITGIYNQSDVIAILLGGFLFFGYRRKKGIAAVPKNQL